MHSSEYKVAYRKILKREFTSTSQTVLEVMLGGSTVPLNVGSLDYNRSRDTLYHVALRQISVSILTRNFLNYSI